MRPLDLVGPKFTRLTVLSRAGSTKAGEWSTRLEQARNRRNNVLVGYLGETLNLTAWSERFGVPPKDIKRRLRAGWSIEKALTFPVRQLPKRT